MARWVDQPQQSEGTSGQQVSEGCQPVRDNDAMADQALLADRAAPPRQDLRQRLGRLPEWHPSSAGWGERHEPERLAGPRSAQSVDGLRRAEPDRR